MMVYVQLQRKQPWVIIVIIRIISDLEKVNMKLLFTVFSRERTTDY